MTPEVKGYVPMDGIFPFWQRSRMSETNALQLFSRISERLKATGKTAAGASREAGLGADYIRDIKRKQKAPSSESLEDLASVLGTTSRYLLRGEEDAPREPVREGEPEIHPIVLTPVLGTIEAGNFREVAAEDHHGEPAYIEAKQNTWFPKLTQYALLVSGESMNKIVQDGQTVICVGFDETGLGFEQGLLVHVERRRYDGQLVEVTLKVIEYRDGEWWFAPRSHDPRFTAFKADGDDGTEVVVMGLAVAIQQDLPTRFY